jgi:hypothetical protein
MKTPLEDALGLPVSPAAIPPVSEPPPVTYRKFGDSAAMRKHVLDNVLGAVQASYPLENARHRLELHGVSYLDEKPYSLKDQKKAILSGQTLNQRLGGEWRLIDKATGQTLDKKKSVVAHVPYVTDRGTFIYRGSEYTVANQMRLKPGVFARQKENGILEAHVNTRPGTGPSFRVYMEPETGIFRLGVGQSTLKMYPILRAMGVPDRDIEKAWGRELLQKNIEAEDPRAVSRAFAKLVATRADMDTGAEDTETVAKAAEELPDIEFIEPKVEPMLKLAFAGEPELELYPDCLIKIGALPLIATTAGVASGGYGGGHAQPGKALAEVLFRGLSSQYNVEHFPYEWDKEVGEHGFYNMAERPTTPRFEEARKYKALLSTGFSPSEAFWRKTPGGSKGTLAPAPTVMFMLDMPASAPHATTNYSMMPAWYAHGERPLVFWGPQGTAPDPDTIRGQRFLAGANIAAQSMARNPVTSPLDLAEQLPKAIANLQAGLPAAAIYHVGSLSPAIAPGVMETLRTPAASREMWEKMLYDLPNSPVPRGSLAGRSVIAVSGSGRGDYVTARVAELQKYLESQGIKDVSTLAFTGGNPERDRAIRQALAGLPESQRRNLHVFGHTPNKEYVTILRGPGDDPRFAHWGSSGASQSLESLLGGGKTLLPADVAAMETASNKTLAGLGLPSDVHAKLVDRNIKWMPNTHRGVLKDWERRGLRLGMTPEHVVSLLRESDAQRAYRLAAAKALPEVEHSQKNTVALMGNLLSSLETKGRFPHSSGIFTPQTHPEMFTRDPAVHAAARQKAQAWFVGKLVRK